MVWTRGQGARRDGARALVITGGLLCLLRFFYYSDLGIPFYGTQQYLILKDRQQKAQGKGIT